MRSVLMMSARLISRKARRQFILMSLSFCLVISVYVTVQSVLGGIRDGRKPFPRSGSEVPGDDSELDTREYVEVWAENQTCKRPKLDLWHPSMKQHFKTPEELHCGDAQHDWIYIQNGTFRIYPAVEQKVGKVMCEYRPLVRLTDDVIKLGNTTKHFKDGDRVLSDFFEIRCISSRGAVYKNLHSAILPKEDLIKRQRGVKPPRESLGLNILMLGFDSVSRLNWIRNLPKSYNYFVNALGGTVLEGYNIVGDGTPQALLPILTGMREEELPETRRGFTNAQHVDDHPWIWKELQKQGYVTQWGEDGAAFGTFNYRMMGFVDPPVDHYLRPFYLWAEEHYYKNNYAFCLGSKPRHVNMLHWIAHFFDAYPNLPKFSFLFHSEFSHEYFSKLSLVDDSVLDFLRYMNGTGYLDNTLLILMSDHGARFTTIRQSQQGKYEERLPFFSFRLPKWFAEKYPEAMANLKDNTQALTTPFDVHATFHDIMNFSSPSKGAKQNKSTSNSRGISLFKSISPFRTCREADIATHWCTCMDWIDTSRDDRHVVATSHEVVKAINRLLKEHLDVCEIVELDSIESAMKFSPNLKMLKFKQSTDDHGRSGDFSDRMHATAEYYQVTIHTKPGGGAFEATVRHEMYHNNTYIVDTSALSRINKYGTHPHCVMKEFPHLRPYCYCKVQL